MVLLTSAAVRAGLAAELATEIDRVALCIHGPTSRRPDLMAALAPLGMPGRSVVVVAARFLAAGRLSSDDLASMSRYEAATDLRKLLESHIRRGLLVEGERDVFTPSPEFQAAGSLVLRLQGEEAERLWSPASSLRDLTGLARAHVEVALASQLTLDAFRRQAGVHHALSTGPAPQLLGYVTELRYLRADVHSACLAAEGLAGPTARTLHRLWRGHAPAGDLEPGLVDAGLVGPGDEPKLTDRGAALLDRVEAATNELFARVFASFDAGASAELLDGMRSLAGEDPRPIEDR